MLGLNSSLNCHLTPAGFNQLRRVIKTFGQSINALLLNEEQFKPLPQPALYSAIDRPFLLLHTPHFQGLLLGAQRTNTRIPQPLSHTDPCVLTFESGTIADFGAILGQFFADSPLWQDWQQQWQASRAQAPDLQVSQHCHSALSLHLVQYFAQDTPSLKATANPYAHVSVCQPIEQALKWRLDQEQVLAQVTVQIRQTLELETILHTALGEVRRLLLADRVVIYRFDDNAVTSNVLDSNLLNHNAVTSNALDSNLLNSNAVNNNAVNNNAVNNNALNNNAVNNNAVNNNAVNNNAVNNNAVNNNAVNNNAVNNNAVNNNAVNNNAVNSNAVNNNACTAQRHPSPALSVLGLADPQHRNPDVAIPPSSFHCPLDASPSQGIAADRYQVFEALAANGVPSVLDPQVQPWLMHQPQDWQALCQGTTIATTDTEKAYRQQPELLQSTRQMQVRSRLTTPILVQGRLWGLLAVHQCHSPRPWSEDERIMVEHIAEHLAIAVYQGQLYQELQAQKQTLEQRVQEYTQELQDALAATQSAHRTKSDFLSTMSHELRTPLTCIIGMSSTLLRWSFGSFSDRQRNYLQTIHDSGEQLLTIINDILELSHLETGRTVLQSSQFSISRTVHSTVQLFQEKARSAQISLYLEVTLAPDQDLFTGDVRRCQQILSNLLSNALKFTKPDGNVVVRVWREQELWVMQVEDTGIGIPEEQQPLLFQKFQQLEHYRVREHGGTGLGLALTKQFVDLHGGNIKVESEVGVGSIFTVWLPPRSLGSSPAPRTLGSSKAPQPPNSVPAATLNPSGQVVLLEDDEETATLICELLTAAGYQVIWLVDASTALEQIELMRPVAVIANLDMAGSGGLQMLWSLRRSPQTQSLKVLALLSRDSPHLEVRAGEPQADLYLRKPFEPDQLVTDLLQLAS
nr:GAF domain-containing hybrid sensor histidine kinase/response regulator [Prochlorothrix hollandica]